MTRTPSSRHLAATVAQYIHELTERHAQDREAVAAVVPVVSVPQTA